MAERHAERTLSLSGTLHRSLSLDRTFHAQPTWLDNAHRKLDEAVFAAYGWPSDLSDDEILLRLLVLNLERASRG
jgi:hypothetical protein